MAARPPPRAFAEGEIDMSLVVQCFRVKMVHSSAAHDTPAYLVPSWVPQTNKILGKLERARGGLGGVEDTDLVALPCPACADLRLDPDYEGEAEEDVECAGCANRRARADLEAAREEGAGRAHPVVLHSVVDGGRRTRELPGVGTAERRLNLGKATLKKHLESGLPLPGHNSAWRVHTIGGATGGVGILAGLRGGHGHGHGGGRRAGHGMGAGSDDSDDSDDSGGGGGGAAVGAHASAAVSYDSDDDADDSEEDEDEDDSDDSDGSDGSDDSDDIDDSNDDAVIDLERMPTGRNKARAGNGAGAKSARGARRGAARSHRSRGNRCPAAGGAAVASAARARGDTKGGRAGKPIPPRTNHWLRKRVLLVKESDPTVRKVMPSVRATYDSPPLPLTTPPHRGRRRGYASEPRLETPASIDAPHTHTHKHTHTHTHARARHAHSYT